MVREWVFDGVSDWVPEEVSDVVTELHLDHLGSVGTTG